MKILQYLPNYLEIDEKTWVTTYVLSKIIDYVVKLAKSDQNLIQIYCVKGLV